MTKHFAIALFFLPAILCADRTAVAQEPPRPTGNRNDTALIVEVTLSRNMGDKVLSSTPYTLAVVSDNRSSLRIGGDVPVPSVMYAAPAAKEDSTGKPAAPTPPTPLSSYSYKSVGTSIDVTAIVALNGQYRLSITIDDSSVYPPDLGPPTSKTTGAPGFRNFKSSNSFLLRDGQKQDYAIGVDRVTGEVMRVSVKLTVEK